MHRPITSPGDGNASSELDRLTKYVRVRSQHDERFVAFDFAIGDPELFVELVLPVCAFEDFCQANGVVQMSDEQMTTVDAQLEKWRYGENTLMARNKGLSPDNNHNPERA